MKREITINPDTGFGYIPKELRDEGLKGKVPLLANALTVTMVKPNAKLGDIRESLLTQLKDIELRIRIYGEDAIL